MSNFDRAWKKAVKEVEDKTSKAVRAVGIRLFSSIIQSTPVGNPALWQSKAPAGYIGGSLRGNWQTTLNTPARGEINSSSATGSSASRAVVANTVNYKLTDTIYLVNNLPYAQRVEDGWSSQRPEGMVKINVAAFKGVVASVARRTR